VDRLPSLADLRRRYVIEERPLPAELEARLRKDARPGAKALLGAIEKRRSKNRSEGQRLRWMLRYESELWTNGVVRVAGVDEVGMSPLAGPVVAAAVILPVGWRFPGVDDSKKLDEPTRDRLAPEIKRAAIGFGIGVVGHQEIDRINIYQAGLLAMRRAIWALPTPCVPEFILIDARKLRDIDVPQRAIIHGDELSLSIAAASIVAKTFRDAKMIAYDQEYPGYGFARHKGYGVREHYDAIDRLGVLPIHRRSFGPVQRAIEARGHRSS
jgi:ribonuclease HII